MRVAGLSELGGSGEAVPATGSTPASYREMPSEAVDMAQHEAMLAELGRRYAVERAWTEELETMHRAPFERAAVELLERGWGSVRTADAQADLRILRFPDGSGVMENVVRFRSRVVGHGRSRLDFARIDLESLIHAFAAALAHRDPGSAPLED
jgi:hypothetical protein